MKQKLVVEYHYPDGDVGVHPAASAEKEVWRGSANEPPTHVVIRPETKGGQATSNRLFASSGLLNACLLLEAAYKNGKRRGGSVDWDEIDQAHATAIEALKKVRAFENTRRKHRNR